jgi:hypothetical protein
MFSEWRDWDADPLAPLDWLVWSVFAILACATLVHNLV